MNEARTAARAKITQRLERSKRRSKWRADTRWQGQSVIQFHYPKLKSPARFKRALLGRLNDAAMECGLTWRDVRSRSRDPYLVLFRRAAARTLRSEEHGLSTNEIGALLGRRHNTTVLNYCQIDGYLWTEIGAWTMAVIGRHLEAQP